MKRERPGQIRVHRGFLQAESLQALWPDIEVRVREVGEPRPAKTLRT